EGHRFDRDAGIGPAQMTRCSLGLGCADVDRGENDLAMQIRRLDGIGIYEPDASAAAVARNREGRRNAKSTDSSGEYAFVFGHREHAFARSGRPKNQTPRSCDKDEGS